MSTSALKLKTFQRNRNESFDASSGPETSLHTQHGQLDSSPPASPASTSQFDCRSIQPGSINDDSDLPAIIRKIRNHQHVDLTMLRLSFRKLITPDRSLNHPLESELRDLSCSEFSNLVSAVSRLHDSERETLGIKPPVPIEDKDKNEIDKLKALALTELIDFCRQEGIMPPDTSQI